MIAGRTTRTGGVTPCNRDAMLRNRLDMGEFFIAPTMAECLSVFYAPIAAIGFVLSQRDHRVAAAPASQAACRELQPRPQGPATPRYDPNFPIASVANTCRMSHRPSRDCAILAGAPAASPWPRCAGLERSPSNRRQSVVPLPSERRHNQLPLNGVSCPILLGSSFLRPPTSV